VNTGANPRLEFTELHGHMARRRSLTSVALARVAMRGEAACIASGAVSSAVQRRNGREQWGADVTTVARIAS
jgi:hypothetical protein